MLGLGTLPLYESLERQYDLILHHSLSLYGLWYIDFFRLHLSMLSVRRVAVENLDERSKLPTVLFVNGQAFTVPNNIQLQLHKDQTPIHATSCCPSAVH